MFGWRSEWKSVAGAIGILVVLIPNAGHAQPEEAEYTDQGTTSVPAARVDLRGAMLALTPGFVSTYLCGDLQLNQRFSLSACGTGSGVLTPDEYRFQDNELVHFRLDWTALERPQFRLLLGAGLAEAELGADRSGFVFRPDEASSAEAAGPELALGFDLPLSLAETRLRLRVDVGAAWIPGLPTIGGPAAFVPFGVLTANALF